MCVCFYLPDITFYVNNVLISNFTILSDKKNVLSKPNSSLKVYANYCLEIKKFQILA